MAWMSCLTVPGYVAVLIYATFARPRRAGLPAGRWRVVGRSRGPRLVEALRFSFPFGGVPLASLGITQAAGPLAGSPEWAG